MTPEEALDQLGGLSYRTPLNAHWSRVPDFIEEDLLEGWLALAGPEDFAERVSMMRKGHAVRSPIDSVFEYKAASIAGQQESLPGIT